MTTEIQDITIGVRGCGVRTEGGLYLVGDPELEPNSWFPRHLKQECPHCGFHGPTVLKPSRNIQSFFPAITFPELEEGQHTRWVDHCTHRGIEVREPFATFEKTEEAFAQTVDTSGYPSPSDYIAEVQKQGYSRRIQALPHRFVPGKTRIFLIHKRAIDAPIGRGGYEPGVIASFVPKAVQYVTFGWETFAEQTIAKYGGPTNEALTAIAKYAGITEQEVVVRYERFRDVVKRGVTPVRVSYDESFSIE